MTSAGTILKFVPLLALLATAAATDLRARRIPNWLTFSMGIAGVLQSFSSIGTVSPLASALGLAAGFGLTFVLFALGALGGGDVKLMAGVGAWVGPAPVVAVFAITALIGMMIVLVQASLQGRLRKLLTNTTVLTVNLIHLQDVGLEHTRATGRASRSVDRPLLVILARQ
jgi:prepilin peptidase CpaA